MKENSNGNPHHTNNRQIVNDDPDKREPNPDDPNEEGGMPIKEMPASDNPHNEELLDYIPK